MVSHKKHSVWSFSKCFFYFGCGQVVSHKKGLVQSLRALQRDDGVAIDSFLPRTYCVDAVIDRVEWAQASKVSPY